MTTTVSDYMRTNTVTLEREDTVFEAAKRMKQSAIGDVLVMEQGRLFGIVTDRDLVTRCLAESRDPARTRVDEVCTENPVTLSPDDRLDAVESLMKDKAVRRLPVVANDAVVGIVALSDLALVHDRRSVLGEVSAAAPNQ